MKEKFQNTHKKDVLRIMQISQATLYRLRKENGLLTQNVKRRFTEEEIEEIGKIIVNKYKTI